VTATSTATDPFHLAWFLNQGFGVGDWRGTWRGTQADDWANGDSYVEFARSLERACFDYLIIEDSGFVADNWAGSSELYLRAGLTVPKHDPAVLATVIAKGTSRLGIVPTLTTTEWPPYLLARYVSTLDHVAAGRAGWNVVTGSSDLAAQNHGKPGQPPHDERYDMADEFVELVCQLWDSWEPGSVVRDSVAGTYTDPTKVHPINFEGTYYRCRGPLNTARSPQGKPVLVQAGGSARGRAFAAKHADCVIASAGTVDEMRGYRADIHREMVASGRKPGECKVLYLTTPFIGETETEAIDRKRRYFQAIHDDPAPTLAFTGFTTNIDFAQYDLDTPIGDLAEQLKTNGHQSSLDKMLRGKQHMTLRDIAAEPRGFHPTGTPEQVADQMAEMMHAIGGDGFLFYLPQATLFNRRTVAEITDGLVPELQRRGLVRTAYAYDHFRDNLLDF